MTKCYLAVFLALIGSTLAAQSIAPFTQVSAATKQLPAVAASAPKPAAATYLYVELPNELAASLAAAPEQSVNKAKATTLTLPNPAGELATFRLFRYQMITEELQAAYPDFVTLYGWDTEQPGRRIQLDWTAKGFSATVTGGREGRWFVNQLAPGDVQHYRAFLASDYPTVLASDHKCGIDEETTQLSAEAVEVKAVGDCSLREYRLALACSGEYFQAVGNDQAAVVSELIRAVNRVNDIYRSELGITFRLINIPTPSGDIQLVYDNPDTDPYTNGDTRAMLLENQFVIDDIIGSDNYDIGHVFGVGGGGLASLSAVCTPRKAQGVSNGFRPANDLFYIDLVSHEIGHQCGAQHSFNSLDGNCGNGRAENNAYEPGSGSTIMAYAGICSGSNIQVNTDPYFHATSIQEINGFTQSSTGGQCANIIATDNNASSADAGPDQVIPANTPFFLTGQSSDPDGDLILYNWEQFDLGAPVNGEPTGNETDGPLFRSFSPTTDPTRYFPNLPSIVAGTDAEYESLPLVTRDMTFILTTRDGSERNYGCTTQDEVTVSVINTGSPFTVTFPNGGEVLTANIPATFDWNVAGTDANGINCANVEIVLSTDGGFSFTESLGVVPNTGSATLTLPDITERDVRAQIRCASGIFFDISDADFSILQPDYTFELSEQVVTACGGNTVSTDFTVGSARNYAGNISFSLVDAPAGVTASFNPTSTVLTPGSRVSAQVTLSGLAGLADGNYDITLQASDLTGPKTETFTLEVLPPLAAPVLVSPADGGDLDPAASFFIWSQVENADDNSGYLWESFRDAAGTQRLFSPQVTSDAAINFGGNLANSLTVGQTYYWRATAINSNCDPVQTASSPIQSFVFRTPPLSGSSLAQDRVRMIACTGFQVANFGLTFRNADLTGPASLQVANVPNGIMVQLSNATLTDGQSTTISVLNEETLPVGLYPFDVQVTGANGAMETATYIIEIEPQEIVISSPQPGDQLPISDDGSARLPVTWNDLSCAETYEVTVFFPNGSDFTLPRTTYPTGQYTVRLNNVQDGDSYGVEVEGFDEFGNSIATSPRTSAGFQPEAALPVEWVTFTATKEAKRVRLNWEVIQDDAHAGFTVERSERADGGDWLALGNLLRSFPNGSARYQYVDETVRANGEYHYRIKQSDLDGAVSYSEIAAVSFTDLTAGLIAYPNPTTGLLQLRLAESEQPGELDFQVVNAVGQLIRSGRLVDGRAAVDLADLPAAVYQVLVRDDRTLLHTARVVKR